MSNFNKLANLHNMFFKKADDLSSKPPVRSSNPPPEPRPNPKKMPDAWSTLGRMPGGAKAQKTFNDRGWTPEGYNANTPLARGARLTSTQHVIDPRNFQSEDPKEDHLTKMIPRLLSGTEQRITPPTSYGAQPVPTGLNSQVAGGTIAGGATAGGIGDVLGGSTSSVSNAPANPDTFNDVTDNPPSGRSSAPSLSDYDKYRQGNPGR